MSKDSAYIVKVKMVLEVYKSKDTDFTTDMLFMSIYFVTKWNIIFFIKHCPF